MPIMVIKGPEKSGKSAFANSLRNSQIQVGNGALLIDDTQQGEVRYLVEKLMAGTSLPVKPREDPTSKAPEEVIPTPADDISWKKDCMVIVVGDHGVAKLDEIEKLVPGFKEKHGPISTLNLEKESVRPAKKP